MKKKNLLYALMLFIIIVTGCTTFKANMLEAERNPISTKLHNLKVSYGDNELNLVLSPAIIAKHIDRQVFENELNTNIMNKRESFYGSIKMNCTAADAKSSLVYPFLSGFSLFTLNILGMPINNNSISAKYDFEIYDINENKIAEYSYDASDKAAIGLYYGKDASVLMTDIAKDVMSRFKQSLRRDVDEINAKLEKAIQPTEVIVEEKEEKTESLSLESTVIRWYVVSVPAGADVYWRVVSSTPDVSNTNQNYLGSTPYESTETFDIKGLTYKNSGNVQIEISCEKIGYHTQRKRFNVRQAIDQKEISTKFNLVSEDE